MNTQAPRLLRFADLREAGIVGNWPQLKRLVDNHRFPAGARLIAWLYSNEARRLAAAGPRISFTAANDPSLTAHLSPRKFVWA